MITSTLQKDDQLKDRLAFLTHSDNDYWSFNSNSRREHSHGIFQYPAMMVPQVARAVLDQACLVHPDIDSVCDPFVGSGTVLTESMLHGLNFSGIDINPLGILLCRVKSGPFFVHALEEKIPELFIRIKNDTSTRIEVNFSNRDKWFRKDNLIFLSKIKRAIVREESLWARRFFWIGLAEAVRLTSNSRTSTFKLHIRPENEIETRKCDPVGIFKKAIIRNLHHIKDHVNCLRKKGYLNRCHYRKKINVTLGDTRNVTQSALNDIILTSPPYGDNTTTVPYGQYSYLPLQWIELEDIDPAVNSDYLSSTHEIDSRSLGGKKKVTKVDLEALADRSHAFKKYIELLKAQPKDRINRVTAFLRDLDACITPVLSLLNPGGLMVWTLGNRKVGGIRVPMDIILSDLLETHRTHLLCKLSRRIPSKRMALKNNIAETMSKETILVMRKAI